MNLAEDMPRMLLEAVSSVLRIPREVVRNTPSFPSQSQRYNVDTRYYLLKTVSATEGLHLLTSFTSPSRSKIFPPRHTRLTTRRLQNTAED